jgi:hypothetical protein
MPWDRYLNLNELSAYTTLPASTLRYYLARANHPIPHKKINGRVYVLRSDFDKWLEPYAHPPIRGAKSRIVLRLAHSH